MLSILVLKNLNNLMTSLHGVMHITENTIYSIPHHDLQKQPRLRKNLKNSARNFEILFTGALITLINFVHFSIGFKNV